MIVENPEVTIEEDAHLLPEGATEHAFIDWGLMSHLKDADGKDYWVDVGVAKFNKLGTFGAMPFGKAPMDMWNFGIRTHKGRVYTPAGTIYKVADFADVTSTSYHPFPGGELRVIRDDVNNHVVVEIDEFRLLSNLNDHTWRITCYDKTLNVRADLTHYGEGFPMWYGKEKIHVYVDHMRAQGYNWAGRVEGTLTIDGKDIPVKGFAGRERFYCPDQSNVEAGGWCDLIMFYFNELQGNLCEMKLSQDKDLALYLFKEKQYFMSGDFNIEHDDWAYLPQIATFIPTTYKITATVEAGTLEILGKVCGCKCLTQGENLQVDVPNLMLDMDYVEGTFTYQDGRKMELTNGFCNSNVVLWKTFPSTILSFGVADKQITGLKPTLG